MLVVLDVVKNKNNSFLDKIKSIFKPYEINADIITKNEIALLHIKYIQKRSDINFKKIYEYTVGASKIILCNNELSLENTPFTRFESNQFNLVMMKKFIIDIIDNLDKQLSQLKISFYDPNAEYPLFAETLLNYTSEISVVSNMPRFYENEAERYMNERGVSMFVSNSLEKLNSCDIIIAPSKINTPIPTVSSSLIFTNDKPLVNISGTVITKYIPQFPNEYIDLKPENLDDFYFLSALYTLCGIIDLEKLDPTIFESNGSFINKEQIIKKIYSKLKC